MSEHLRSLTRVVALAALLLAGRAGAGDAPPFGSPFNFPCPDDFIGAIYTETPDVFAGVGDAKLCSKLCTQALKECKAWAKAATKCKVKLYVGGSSYAKTACGTLMQGADDNCRAGVKADRALTAQLLKNDLAAFTADCESWASDCDTECTAP